MDANTIGPVEFLIIDFPGNRFTDDLAPALADLVGRGVVHVIDLVFVSKDADGNVAWFECDDLEELAAYAPVDGEAEGLLSDEDIIELSEELAPDSSALFIVWEDTWARDLAVAVRAAGGRIAAGERIPHDAVLELFADIDD